MARPGRVAGTRCGAAGSRADRHSPAGCSVSRSSRDAARGRCQHRPAEPTGRMAGPACRGTRNVPGLAAHCSGRVRPARRVATIRFGIPDAVRCGCVRCQPAAPGDALGHAWRHQRCHGPRCRGRHGGPLAGWRPALPQLCAAGLRAGTLLPALRSVPGLSRGIQAQLATRQLDSRPAAHLACRQVVRCWAGPSIPARGHAGYGHTRLRRAAPGRRS